MIDFKGLKDNLDFFKSVRGLRGYVKKGRHETKKFHTKH